MLMVTLLSLATGGCTGTIAEPSDRGGAGPGTPNAEPLDVCAEGEEHAPPARLWLLTDVQHRNAIGDLLGDGIALPDVRTPGASAHQFVHEAALYRVAAPLLTQYQAAAEAAADQAVDRLDALLPCDATADGEAACAEAFIRDFVPRAFRRPLEPAEQEELADIYALGAEEGFAAGIALVIEAVLQAPDFLYRTELGAATAEGTVVELTPHELAASLSFLLLDSIPDRPLWEAAEDGSLADPAVLESHVERLLALPRVRSHLEEVVLTWIGATRVLSLEKDPTLYPEFDEPLRQSMVEETQRFVRDVLWERGGSLDELLTSPRTFVDDRLATHYGVEPLPDGPGWVELDPTERAGILTQASILSALAGPAHTSIVHRGLFVNRLFLCMPEVVPPPPDLIDSVADETRGLSERELATYRAGNETCAACHVRIDPPGIALEHYDPVGRHRVEADGAPVDAASRIALGDAPPREVDGAVDLAHALAESDEVAACIAEQMVQFAFGRVLGRDAVCSRAEVVERFEASDRDLVDVFRAIPSTAAFRTRSREVP